MRHKSHTVKVIYKECKTRQAKQKNNIPPQKINKGLAEESFIAVMHTVVAKSLLHYDISVGCGQRCNQTHIWPQKSLAGVHNKN